MPISYLVYDLPAIYALYFRQPLLALYSFPPQFYCFLHDRQSFGPHLQHILNRRLFHVHYQMFSLEY